MNIDEARKTRPPLYVSLESVRDFLNHLLDLEDSLLAEGSQDEAEFYQEAREMVHRSMLQSTPYNRAETVFSIMRRWKSSKTVTFNSIKREQYTTLINNFKAYIDIFQTPVDTTSIIAFDEIEEIYTVRRNQWRRNTR